MRGDAADPSHGSLGGGGGTEQLLHEHQGELAGGTEGSPPLVDVTFRSHSAQEALGNPRVPEGITAVGWAHARARPWHCTREAGWACLCTHACSYSQPYMLWMLIMIMAWNTHMPHVLSCTRGGAHLLVHTQRRGLECRHACLMVDAHLMERQANPHEHCSMHAHMGSRLPFVHPHIAVMLLLLLLLLLLQFYSLEAQLRALQLVFLKRSLDELLDYITGEAGPRHSWRGRVTPQVMQGRVTPQVMQGRVTPQVMQGDTSGEAGLLWPPLTRRPNQPSDPIDLLCLKHAHPTRYPPPTSPPLPCLALPCLSVHAFRLGLTVHAFVLCHTLWLCAWSWRPCKLRHAGVAQLTKTYQSDCYMLLHCWRTLSSYAISLHRASVMHRFHCPSHCHVSAPQTKDLAMLIQ